jgi:multiple sugar transport system substrate-binding protein
MAKGKLILIAFVLILVLLGLWSALHCAPFNKCVWERCNGKNCPVSSKEAKKVTLTFAGAWDTDKQWETVIQNFRDYEIKKRGLNVLVQYEQLDKYNYEDILLDRMLNKKSPNLFLVYNTWVPKYKNRIEPMPSGYLTLDQFAKYFPQVAQKDLVADGKIYSVPAYIDTLALYYNKDMFANAGIIEPPTTWAEFATDVEKLTVPGKSGAITRLGATVGGAANVDASSDIVMLMVMQNNLKSANTNGNLVSFNTAEAKNAVKFYTDFADPSSKFYTWNYQDQTYSVDHFVNLHAAMSINYSDEIQNINDKTGGSLNYAVAPVPQQYPNDKVNYASYWTPVVSNDATCVEEKGVTVKCDALAWDFMQYIATDKNIAPYIEATGRPAASLTLAKTQAEKDGSKLAPFASQILTAKSWANVDNTKNKTTLVDMLDSIITPDKQKKSTVTDAVAKARGVIKELN